MPKQAKGKTTGKKVNNQNNVVIEEDDAIINQARINKKSNKLVNTETNEDSDVEEDVSIINQINKKKNEELEESVDEVEENEDDNFNDNNEIDDEDMAEVAEGDEGEEVEGEVEIEGEGEGDEDVKSKGKLKTMDKDDTGDADEYDEKCVYKYADNDSDDEEIVFDDDGLEIISEIISADKRRTKPILFKYERVRLLGDRAQQLTLGAKPMIKNVEGLTPKEIAELEIEQNVIPLIIQRPLPNGKKERWYIKELKH